MPEKLEVVYFAMGEAEAQIVKGRLEKEGIPVLLRYATGGAYGVPAGNLGGVQVLVPSESAPRARLILSSEPPGEPVP